MKEKIKISRCKTFSSVSDDDRDYEDVMNHNRRQLQTTRNSAIPCNVTTKLNDFYKWNDQIEYFMFKSRSSEHNDWIVMNSNYKGKDKDSLGAHDGSKSSFHFVRVEEEVLVNQIRCDLSDQYRHDSNWKSCRALPPITIGVSSSSSSNSCKMTERWCSLIIWYLYETSYLSIDRECEFPHLGQGSIDRRQSSIIFMFSFVWLRSQHTSDFAHKSLGIMRSSFRAQQLRVFFLQTMILDLYSASRLLNVSISADSSVSRVRSRSSSADTAIFSDCIVLTRFLKRVLSWANIPERLQFDGDHHSDLQIEANIAEVQFSSERCIRRWDSHVIQIQEVSHSSNNFCDDEGDYSVSVTSSDDQFLSWPMKLISELSCIHVRDSVDSRHYWHNFDLFQGTWREIQSNILELILLKM